MLNTEFSELFTLTDWSIQTASLVKTEHADFGLARQNGETKLIILSDTPDVLTRFDGERAPHGDQTLLIGATNATNAAQLRLALPWLIARPLGTQTSAGFGDRLGLATPGHIHALRAVAGSIAPIFAQQSIREMTRTERTAQQVMDDAMWGVFGEGWRDGFGADADHLKTPADIDCCAAAGFTFYTIDPGEYVDDRVYADDAALSQAFAALPWADLQDSAADLPTRYARPVDLESSAVTFDPAILQQAAVKYGRVVAHVHHMAQYLRQVSNQLFELEISVDETNSVTSHAEHVYLATEFKRLGVTYVSLAPRYVGRFEKGVDYIGDLAAFRADFAIHAEIARAFGSYKLSLHSGSDKFGIYPIAAELTRGVVHLKTAGTSYLEALRTAAALDPALFREMYAFARAHYETDRASYHVSAELDKAPLPETITDGDLPTLLEQFDARQILHVTFGSTLIARNTNGSTRFKDQLLNVLRTHPEAYAAVLEKHFIRHLAPFANRKSS